jgi:hypothetical protein
MEVEVLLMKKWLNSDVGLKKTTVQFIALANTIRWFLLWTERDAAFHVLLD